jgi:hypothetical protein
VNRIAFSPLPSTGMAGLAEHGPSNGSQKRSDHHDHPYPTQYSARLPWQRVHFRHDGVSLPLGRRASRVALQVSPQALVVRLPHRAFVSAIVTAVEAPIAGITVSSVAEYPAAEARSFTFSLGKF